MFNRRSFIAAALGGALLLTQGGAMAQTSWPERPVRFIVPFAPGGGVDIAARLIGEHLQKHWQQPVIIENRPGANTLIAAQAVQSAAKDGYTLLITNAPTFYLPAVNPSVTLRPLEEFVPIAELTVDQLVVIAPASLKANTLNDVLELAKKDPKSFAYGSYGYGTVAHLLLHEINTTRGLDLVHIPYRGTAPLIQAMLAGDVNLGVTNYGTAKPFIESGKLQPLAVMGTPRSPFMPDVPTLSEEGVTRFETYQWVGVFAPAGVPNELIQKISKDIQTVIHSEPVTKRLADFFTRPGTKHTDEFRALVERDAKVQGGMSQAAGIRMGD